MPAWSCLPQRLVPNAHHAFAAQCCSTCDSAAVEDLTIACLENISDAFNDARNPSCISGTRKALALGGHPRITLEHDPSHRKAVWAIEGPRNMENLCRQLRIYNDMLDIVWKRSHAAVARRLLPDLNGINSIDGLQLIEKSFRGGNCLELASTIRFRQACLEERIKDGGHSACVVPGDIHHSAKLGLNACDFPPDFFSPQLHHTTIGEKVVLLEWKEFPKSPGMASTLSQSEYDHHANANIQGLARVLAKHSKPETLRTLNCVGCYQIPTGGSSKRVCFAFEPPAGPSTEPISLQDLIDGSQSYREGRFLLGDQFAFAQGLASSVYQLLFADWPHKGIRSNSVYFFKPRSAERGWRADPKTFFLMGYQLAMIDTIHSFVEIDLDIEHQRYVDPRLCQRKKITYEPQHDIYSLGIVLIEIALWKTARQLAKALGNFSGDSLAAFQISVMDVLVPKVEEKVGEVYADAVRFCLRRDFGSTVQSSRLLKLFNQEVTAKLEACSA
ncbi:hypothetical protein B0T16DRAFT_392701 [Cercophora newfieldiana]|uniref:Protein kinase domain-containing protein n=1 Tax=Cercophora newfieldiana TaxID=92897 RepID=A0AA40CMX8_9PEZI|nr:hypothetical protein B0T16DRAFT_392701 [Cercophora newfieldiana]